MAKSVLVQKFGGTSVGDTEKIRRVARIIADTVAQGYQVVTVVSAMGHTTDALVDLARDIVPNPRGREYDALLATGEMVSTALLAMAVESLGQPAVGLNGCQAGIRTEDLFNNARIAVIDPKLIQKHLDEGKAVIVTGFQGQDAAGNITTLGRGGSDTSAVALAAVLGAERCDIYTDVRGVYTADPRMVPTAYKQEKMAYIEMMELSRLGAQVLHPRAVETAYHAGVPLCVRSTFDLTDPGTVLMDIDAFRDQDGLIEADRAVVGIAADSSQVRLAMRGIPDEPGMAASLFNTLAEREISVDMIIQSLGADGQTNDIAFTIGESDLDDALAVLEPLRQQIGATDVTADKDITKVSIVGAGMVDRPGIAAGMFDALAEAGVNIKMIATSEIKVSCLVNRDAKETAVTAIHERFFPGQPQSQHATKPAKGQATASDGVLVSELGY